MKIVKSLRDAPPRQPIQSMQREGYRDAPRNPKQPEQWHDGERLRLRLTTRMSTSLSLASNVRRPGF